MNQVSKNGVTPRLCLRFTTTCGDLVRLFTSTRIVDRRSIGTKENTIEMVENAKLVDRQSSTFSVLGILNFQLDGHFYWKIEDLNSDGHLGASFYGYEAVEEGEPEYLGYVLFCDVSKDEEEPDISLVDKSNLEEVDSYLRETISRQFEVIDWFNPKLNETNDGRKALMSGYKVLDDGEIYQFAACRLNNTGTNWVMMCGFKPDRVSDFGKAVWASLSSAYFL